MTTGRGPGPPAGWLSAAEAARRLGIKRETLYAYVSRGMLTRQREVGGRQSCFDPAEVARLAERARSGGRAGRLDIVVDSALTRLDPAGKLWYRGWDAEAACEAASFEEVAEWLWTGGPEEGAVAGRAGIATDSTPVALASVPASAPVPVPFEAPEGILAVARRATGALAASARPIDRLRVALPAAATADPLRFDRRPDAVAAAGRRIIAMLVDTLTPPRPGPSAPDSPEGSRGPLEEPVPSIAARLWSGLCNETGTAQQVAVLDAALILLADHEMASSTLAARVAASTWADPYLVVTAGLAALGGPLHGSVGDRLVPMLHDAVERGAAEAIAGRWRLGEKVGGFGHLVYTDRDPRAAALWPRLRDAWPGNAVIEATAAVMAAVTAHGDTFPNADLVLAALVASAGMLEGSAEVIFSIARTAGWLAHAIEEYEHRLRFRLRAAYVGPLPGPSGR